VKRINSLGNFGKTKDASFGASGKEKFLITSGGGGALQCHASSRQNWKRGGLTKSAGDLWADATSLNGFTGDVAAQGESAAFWGEHLQWTSSRGDQIKKVGTQGSRQKEEVQRLKELNRLVGIAMTSRGPNCAGLTKGQRCENGKRIGLGGKKQVNDARESTKGAGASAAR